MTPSITLVTHAGAPDGVADDHLLADAIGATGCAVRYAAWTDPGVDWSASAVTVIRSTWDYHRQPAAWRAWLDRVASGTRLVNAPALVRWNSEKTYLLDLAARGVPIVPTIVLEQDTEVRAACAAHGWDDVVIKPTIGASTFGARRFRGTAILQDGVAHAQALTRDGQALLQPYQLAIETARERSLVYIDGAFGHAFSKPGFYQGTERGVLIEHHPSEAEQAVAQQVLAALPEAPTVARIDLLPTEAGVLLMEAELIEPMLALHFQPETTRRLADSLVRMARGSDAPPPAPPLSRSPVAG